MVGIIPSLILVMIINMQSITAINTLPSISVRLELLAIGIHIGAPLVSYWGRKVIPLSPS